MYQSIHPGYTTVHTYTRCPVHVLSARCSAGEQSSGLKTENNIGYEAQRGSQDLRSVREDRDLCAELFPSSRVKRRKDWIDIG